MGGHRKGIFPKKYFLVHGSARASPLRVSGISCCASRVCKYVPSPTQYMRPLFVPGATCRVLSHISRSSYLPLSPLCLVATSRIFHHPDHPVLLPPGVQHIFHGSVDRVLGQPGEALRLQPAPRREAHSSSRGTSSDLAGKAYYSI